MVVCDGSSFILSWGRGGEGGRQRCTNKSKYGRHPIVAIAKDALGCKQKKKACNLYHISATTLFIKGLLIASRFNYSNSSIK